MRSDLSDGEIAILTLLAEAPRHGYEIEQLIEERGFREWIAIAFSSIYFVLERLTKRGLVTAPPAARSPRTRRPHEITEAGRDALKARAVKAIAQPVATPSPMLVGMANWPLLGKRGTEAMDQRAEALTREIARLEATRDEQDPPDFVRAMFDYAIGQLAVDLSWTISTRKQLESTMPALDLKKTHKTLFAPTAKDFVEVDVPKLNFVKIDGEGDPNTAPAYKVAVEWLYGVSYAMKFAAKAKGKDYVVPPLEALWWADDPTSFVTRDKGKWKWTVMIMAPDFVTQAIFAEAVAKTAAKRNDKPDSLRFEAFDEGRSLQILHVGSYDAEGPTLARLHEEIMPERGLTFNGPHHEIYLSDPRKTEPAKLKTILRQPVK